MISVALCIRPTYLTRYGGDSVQVIKTKEYLENKYDIKCNIITSHKQLTSDYDIVHIFNFATINETTLFIKKALFLHLKIVTSSIYWDYKYLAVSSFFSLFNYNIPLSEINIRLALLCVKVTKQLFDKPTLLSKKFSNYISWCIKNSDIVSPNSIEEAKLLFKFAQLDYKSNEKKISVIYNATDSIGKYAIYNIKEKYNLPDNYILQVGRIEFIKNQLNLLKALRKHAEIPIVFVGAIGEQKYYKKLKKLADRRGNVIFINNIPHDEIYSFYNYAKLHVLLSLRESPGLVSLEALQSGCKIIVSDERFLPFGTYFTNNAIKCSPLDLNEIERTVLTEYYSEGRKTHSTNKFTWDQTADQTFSVYKRLIDANAK